MFPWIQVSKPLWIRILWHYCTYFPKRERLLRCRLIILHPKSRPKHRFATTEHWFTSRKHRFLAIIDAWYVCCSPENSSFLNHLTHFKFIVVVRCKKGAYRRFNRFFLFIVRLHHFIYLTFSHVDTSYQSFWPDGLQGVIFIKRHILIFLW